MLYIFDLNLFTPLITLQFFHVMFVSVANSFLLLCYVLLFECHSLSILLSVERIFSIFLLSQKAAINNEKHIFIPLSEYLTEK